MRSKTSRGTLGEVQERLGTLVGPAERSGTGRETLDEVQNESREPRGGSGGVGGPSRMFGTSRGILGEVWDGSVDPWKVED